MEKRCSHCKEQIEPVSRTVCIKCLGTSFDYSYVDQGFETQEEVGQSLAVEYGQNTPNPYDLNEAP